MKGTNEESQEPITTGLVNLPVNTSIGYEDDQQIFNQASSVEPKRDNSQKTEIKSYLYYAMELCNEDTLKSRLSPSSLTKEEICTILRQIIETTAYIHEKKLVSTLPKKSFTVLLFRFMVILNLKISSFLRRIRLKSEILVSQLNC